MLRKLVNERDEVLEPLENAGKVSGFQSPAQDYVNRRLDIEHKFQHDPINTFYFESQRDLPTYFIRKGDILIVDRSKSPLLNNLVIAWFDQQWNICQHVVRGKNKCLINCFDKLEISLGEEGLQVFGVVTGHYSEDL